jgi:1,4-dihydroxy-2-naphthoate octaprenyltransferase
VNLLKLIRYRFFLFAGLFPYFLGQAAAFHVNGKLDRVNFWVGFTGIFIVLAAVELFNEYFDAKQGGDRIFAQQLPDIPHWFYKLGILALCLALIIGLYLTSRTGWPVLLFSFLGFLGAYFYVGPPIRWAYRGFGESVIALCYGPFMVLGSYYIQTQRIDFLPFFISVISGLSVFCLAVLNEIPDFYQDRLVGKQNLVVRFGRQKAILLLKLGLAAVFTLLISGVVFKTIPPLAILGVLTLPWLVKSIKIASQNYDNPKPFLFAVNTIVINHVVITLFLVVSLLKG